MNESIDNIRQVERHLLSIGESWYANILDDAIETLEAQSPKCKNCLHYHKGARLRSGTEIPDAGFCELLERVFLKADYCSYYAGVNRDVDANA